MAHFWHPFADMASVAAHGELVLVRGDGAHVWDESGRRYLDATPALYLRQVRLTHAHDDLRAADPTHGDEVATIARRWGFGDPRRFADHYRTAYGRSPSDTLHH